MHLNAKGRYAVAAMLDLALRARARPVALSSISERQRVSLSYLEQMFGRLRRFQLVESRRGPGGGYALARSPESITVADIVRAVDDAGARPDRNGHRSGVEAAAGRISVDELWARIDALTTEHLERITLHQLVLERRLGTAAATGDRSSMSCACATEATDGDAGGSSRVAPR